LLKIGLIDFRFLQQPLVARNQCLYAVHCDADGSSATNDAVVRVILAIDVTDEQMGRQILKTFLPVIAAILVSSNCTVEGDTFFADEAAPEFFERRIRPLLADSCLKCHGPEKQWAGLRLDSREAILAGGESGPAVIPGDPEGSLLIRAVRHADDAPKMPEEGQLSESQIRDLEAWVKSGAFFPNSDSGNQRSRDPNHWAFQPPVRPILPEVKNRERIQTDMDLFIQEKLEAAGLSLSDPADRQTLLRRVTYDLTGLPPTPEEVAAFRDDTGADAWSKVVDRLLDSPAYGERWGRRWLDVVRYADSNGLDENIAHGNAWRYRDYVVNSFNADKPFDRMIHEQIAGDLIPAESDSIRQEQLIATGFLSIGPKVLAEVNQPKMRMDIVDEQIDTVGRVFLGMTFGCARCHDHKFDPIETEDYYGLAGIFRSTKTMDSYTKVARWHEHPLAMEDAFYQAQKKQHDADVSAKKQQVEKIIADAVAALAASGNAVSEPSADAEGRFPESVRMELAKLREALAKLEKEPPESPSAMGVTEDEVADTAVHVRGNPLKLGDTVVRHVPVVMKGPQLPEFSSKQSGRKELAAWLTDAKNPLTSRVIVNRVWRWHFGQGIVRSTENFGIPGERPSHPELLDWLALHFVDKGWSMKSLHRLILNSAVWQQSSRAGSLTLEKDPENRLFSRYSVRRLEAEEIRDSMLAVSGRLDRTVGGSLLKVKNRGYLFDHTSIDLSDYTSQRRSLYLPVIRNHVYDLFQLFDFPDPAVPTGSRNSTTIAPQALMMMNSDFVMQSGDDLAERVLSSSDVKLDSSDADNLRIRLHVLYRLVFGRDCTEAEIEVHQTYLEQIESAISNDEKDSQKRIHRAWSLLCHTLLASSEFIYLQ
jgi:hypothetical protein